MGWVIFGVLFGVIFYFWAKLVIFAVVFYAILIKWMLHFLEFLLNKFKKEIPLNKELKVTPDELNSIIKEIKKNRTKYKGKVTIDINDNGKKSSIVL